jgi:signal transduction histidine kinase
MSDTYKEAYEREREARLLAEKVLDEKTREVQSSIDMIQFQFNDLMKQKKESDYLLAIAQLAKSDLDLAGLVKQYIMATVKYLEADVARYTYLKENVVMHGDAIGKEAQLPNYKGDFYSKIYLMENRFTCSLNDINHPSLTNKLLEREINRVLFLPIKCFGKVSTVCEIYLPKALDIESDILDQCQVAGYQIGGMIEANINVKKLKSSYLELKTSNDKLKKAQSQLVHSEKMASLGQLAAGVAHEINNPIGFVTSNIETLKDYSSSIADYFVLSQQYLKSPEAKIKQDIQELDDEQDFTYVLNDIGELITESVGGLIRVKDIVANLKSFARTDDEETCAFDVNHCIEDMVKVVWNELKYHVTLHKELQKDLPKIDGHEGQVGQVIMNILVNAAQSMEAEGDIYISSQKVGEHLKISIKDNGKGMSAALQENIFDPFFTTKDVSEGTGLGLSISYGIIEKHGGSIEVTSKEKEGAEFTILLPVTRVQ